MTADPRQTLYVSDLDGTLLRSDGTLSPYSVRTLNRLIGEGLRFTVASARGCGPIRSALHGLRLSLPVINQNGAFVSDLASGRHLATRALPPAIARDLWSLLDDAGCRPFLMTFDGAFDRLYYDDAVLCNDGMRRFLHDRQRVADPRLASIDHLARGLEDEVVCLTTIDTLPRVRHVEREMRRRHGGSIDIHCHKEFDPHWYVLAVHDARATKDRGIVGVKHLRNLGDCRLVVFGDQVNDIGMFRMADEACAVAGAAPELVGHATAIIGSNDDDAVARWLETQWRSKLYANRNRREIDTTDHAPGPPHRRRDDPHRFDPSRRGDEP